MSLFKKSEFTPQERRKISQKKWRDTHKEDIKNYNSHYKTTHQEYFTEYRKQYYSNNKKYFQDHHQKYYQKYKEMIKIRDKIRNKKLLGFKGKQIRLDHNPRTGTCSKCKRSTTTNEIKLTHMHHEKYDETNPLAHTIELCASCHAKTHVELRRAK